MDNETPKNYDRKAQFTSPIGLLKQNSTQVTSNQYEEEFYKIKAQRLEAQVSELKEENSILKTKYFDSNTVNQILKEKLIALEQALDMTNRELTQRPPSFGLQANYQGSQNSGDSPSKSSKYYSVSAPAQKWQRSYNAEIERLVKENRVIKNEHEVEMSKLRDEVKRLSRKISELESSNNKKSENEGEVEQRVFRQKQEERLLKIEKINNDLRKNNAEYDKQRKKLEDKISALEESNMALRRENQEFRTKGSFDDYSISKQSQHDYEKQILNLKSQVQRLQKKVRMEKTVENQVQQLELLKRKIALQEQNLSEKDDEIKNILTKLKPLLEKEKDKCVDSAEQEGGELKRASLSILEVFLKKYRINSF